jgi:signal transduction histidine kinase/ActR/RegA family two-component response regulator
VGDGTSTTAMPDPNRQAGQTLDARRRPLAEAAVVRQYARQPELGQRYGEGGRAKCVQDTEYHLATLAAAVTFASPALFRDYSAWARATLAAHGVAPEDAQANLACLRDVLGEQLPGEMRPTVIPYVEDALRALAAAPTAPSSFLGGDDALSELARQYLQALLRGERHTAGRLVLDALRAGVAVCDLYLQVFARCQREVGRLWQVRQASVAQEHYCTAATQLVMSQLYPHLFALPKKGRRLVAASVAGESHELGLRIVTDLFEADGWDTLYLGADLPPGGVVRAVADHRPDLLLISATMAFHLPAAEQLIARVRSSEDGQGVKILVGGPPFNVDPELWRRVGADGSAPDAGEALDAAARLLNLQPPGERTGRRIYPADLLAGAAGRQQPPQRPEAAVYDELSRLNNELLTAQRELARQNARLERVNEQLAEADRRKDEFLALLAHELRNPLAPLRSAALLLGQPGLDRSQLDRAGAVVGRQVQQLGRLVDDLLDLSRIARGKMQLRKEWLDLGQVVGRAADASRPLIEARRHELTVSVPEAPVPLLADPTRLEQVLTNLLNNAARYTPEGGRVWLSAAREGGDAVVRVRDTGIGIPPEMLPVIFGLFAQTGRAEERAGGGLGIGLALVKSLTELHGGRVEARSGGPGQGSEFVVRWPLPADEAPGPRRPPVAEPPAVEGALRVLLVDDNADGAESLAMLLRLWGHEVAVAHDGPAGLRSAAAQRPAVALLDISLPGMDGYELARRLRALPGLGRTMLVAMTGWGREEDRSRSREAGFDAHLVKPLELTALQELLARAQRHEGPR